jgi:hypothetical protein
MVAHRATKWKYLVAHKNIWLPEILAQARKMVIGSKEIAGTSKKV